MVFPSRLSASESRPKIRVKAGPKIRVVDVTPYGSPHLWLLAILGNARAGVKTAREPMSMERA